MLRPVIMSAVRKVRFSLDLAVVVVESLEGGGGNWAVVNFYQVLLSINLKSQWLECVLSYGLLNKLKWSIRE